MVVAEKLIRLGLRNTENKLFRKGGTWYPGLDSNANFIKFLYIVVL